MSSFLINGSTRIYGIIGHPVTHSFSPPMQNAAFQALSINAAYLAFDILPENLIQAIEGIRVFNIAGLNITVPYKTQVLPYLDDITMTAQRIGAVNTIRNDNGRLIGTNTDGIGFLRSLNEFSFSPQNKTIALLGAGGAGRAILVALAEAHASLIYLINRTHEKAQRLVSEFQQFFPHTHLKAIFVESLKNLEIDLLVNATTVGMHEQRCSIDLRSIKTVNHVADIIYNPTQTPLLIAAAERHIPAINGAGMLLYQGCEAFQFWTGQLAPVNIMQEQLLKQLAQFGHL